MKKVFIFIMTFFVSSILFAQSAEYQRHLNQAKKYEAEKRWCFALGSYYDAMATDDEPELKQEAYDAYMELVEEIVNGNPGKGKFNVFTIHDEWKKLLIDAEKYGSSFNIYNLTIGELVLGDLNYETKTASYSASVSVDVSERYVCTIAMIQAGYEEAFKSDWISDLPKPDDWPFISVSSNKDSVYNVDGALIFAIDIKDYNYISTHKYFLNAFAANLGSFAVHANYNNYCLFDYKFNIVDELGNEVVKPKRFLLGKEKSIIFEGVSPEAMDLIDNGKAFINPVAVYLEYGKYNPSDDKGGRSFIKNFPEVELDLEKAVFYGANQKGNIKGENVYSTMEWKEKKAAEEELRKELMIAEERLRPLFEELKFVEIPGQNYSMSATEVTQKIYEAVMGENPSEYIGENKPVERVSWYDAIYFCNLLSEIEGKTPVYSVNGSSNIKAWEYTPHKGESISNKVEQNITADGYRLPTEKEWEYAAKGGEEFKYSGSDNDDEVGWHAFNSHNKTHPVAQKKANGYGLYDMSGNVWEWCWDVNPKYSNCRYYRGGGYDYTGGCKVSDRDYYSHAYSQYGNLGFRIVYSASN